MTKGRTTLHSDPFNLPSNAPRDAALIEFGRRLQQAMIEKGWNQSELARRATQGMGRGIVTRAQISNYVRGVVMPTPPHLHAIAKALDKDPGYLVPVRGVRQGWTPMPNEDISGKLECVSCGAILVDTPKDAQQFTVIVCDHCKRILGTWGDLQDELLRVRGAFDLDPGRVRRR